MGASEKATATYHPDRECCDTPQGGDHMVHCPLWEPALTVEELRHLRATILVGIIST